MRKFLICTLALLLCSIAAAAQTGQAKITLKNGTVLTGTLMQLDAVSSVTVKIGDISTTIPMSEVAAIESSNGNADKKAAPATDDIGDEYGKYVVTDRKEYPDSFQITVANQTFTMLLVRGGKFNMGYDDRKSRSMDSEPVHRVELSSFYVSKEFITVNTANRLLANEGDTLQTSNLRCRWRYAKLIVDSIAAKTDTPYRMLTEAEWEYAAIQPETERVFSEITSTADYAKEYYIGEWCADFLAEYSAKPQVNPTGPTKGEKHVARTYRPDKDKWNRDSYDNTDRGGHWAYGNWVDESDTALIRFAISANQINDRIKK